MRPPLLRDEIVKAIEHRNPRRVPMIFHHYAPSDNFPQDKTRLLELFRQYPMDVAFYLQQNPEVWQQPWSLPGYSWMRRPAPPADQLPGGLDAQVAIADWSQLDEILAHLPDPAAPGAYPHYGEDAPEPAGRYTLLHWWNCLFEKAWKLRGMENLLADFYLNPEPVHRLLEGITDWSCQAIRRGAQHLELDGIWVTDDIGMQTGPMFGLQTFRDFIKPCYARIVRTCHDLGLHFWLHSCGSVELFLEDLVEIEVDVIHPIQKYTMNEARIAKRFGGQICFWAGMDCQQILPRGTPDQVRREVRFLIDTFDRPEGGCMMALGNVATADVPMDNLAALFDEAYEYGQSHRRRPSR